MLVNNTLLAVIVQFAYNVHPAVLLVNVEKDRSKSTCDALLQQQAAARAPAVANHFLTAHHHFAARHRSLLLYSVFCLSSRHFAVILSGASFLCLARLVDS